MGLVATSTEKRNRWALAALWLAPAALAAFGVVLLLRGRSLESTGIVPASALPDVMPKPDEMALLRQGATLLSESPWWEPPPLCNGAGFWRGIEQSWGGRGTRTVDVLVAVFATRDAAVQAHAQWQQFNSMPSRPVSRRPIGERCRFWDQGGWTVEFFRANVYVVVASPEGDEALVRRVAQLIDAKAREALVHPDGENAR